MSMQSCREIATKIDAKSMRNPSKMTPKSTRMHTKSGKIDPGAVLDRRLRPGRFREARGTSVSSLLEAFGVENGGPRVDFETHRKPENATKSSF